VHVRWLELAGFRSYPSLSFAPEPGLNALVGRNGQGKTALLESLSVLLTGRSFRTTRLAECIAWDAGERALVAGEVVEGGAVRRVRLELVAEGARGELRGELCPWARAVTFTAEDLGLVAGPPPLRRAYLDGAAAKLWPAHAAVCRRYRLVLQQRARLLGDLGPRADRDRLLAPWDEQVAGLGAEIIHRRLEALAVLAAEAGGIHRALAPAAGAVEFRYTPATEPGVGPGQTRERLLHALGAARAAEVRRGHTLVGPHRDELVVRLGRADARTAASRGEQRVLALTLRLAEAAAVRRQLGVVPVFLLDDLLSELDGGTRERVLRWLGGLGQALFSATDAVLEAAGAGTVWEVRGGEVRESVRTRGTA
jgi:DNA replication and repair protein RecF